MVQHLVKLCVGVDSVEHLEALRADRRTQRRAVGIRDNPVHVTRMTPRRSAEVLRGGSLFWVIKGSILVRSPILALESVTGEDGIKRCRMVFDHPLVPTEIQPRRPFQGWRYLSEEDAPRDLDPTMADKGLPRELEAELRKLGAW